MQTLLLDSTQENINKAGEILRNGGLVGMPTETVYGLAADALNGKAVAKIFKAKGRPMDNPLIVHIAEFGDIEKFGLVAEIPQKAKILVEKFMPGPLTIIMKNRRLFLTKCRQVLKPLQSAVRHTLLQERSLRRQIHRSLRRPQTFRVLRVLQPQPML